jgi:hypothetical protein
MKTITLQEARRRSGLDLLNDGQVFFADYLLGRSGTVAEGQKMMARMYPLHGEIVDAGKRFFASRGFDIYPRGLTVNGAGTCPDFAIFKQNRVTFVECLTAGWSDWRNLKRKSKLARHGQIAFIVEHPEFADLTAGERNRLAARLHILSKLFPVYLYHPAKRAVTRFSSPQAL